jgi:MICOS complex subunit MIC19
LIDSLQASSEVCDPAELDLSLRAILRRGRANDSVFKQSNSTRAKTLELHIQQRVAAELEKIRNHESSALEAARSKIAEASSTDSKSISPKDLIPGTQNDEEQKRKAQTSQKVQQEIEKLKQQLGQRKTVKELPKDLENA